MTWELAIQLILATVAASGAIGSFYAIRRQLKMEKLEKRKLIVEAESISADVAAKLINSAGDLQDFYAELLQEIKKQLEENRTIICRLEGKIDIITEENINLKSMIEKANKKIEKLEEGIRILSKQIRELGQEPRYPKEE